MTTTECPSENHVLEYIANGSRDQALERHLDVCQACRQLIGALIKNAEPSEAITAVAAPSLSSPSAPRIFENEPLELPDELARYRITGILGSGGMGVVYRADDPDLGRELAIKLVRPEHHAVCRQTRGNQHLLAEGRALAQLSHDNVITIHDVGESPAGVFLAMELLEGGTLTKWLLSPRTSREIVEKFIAAGRGLAAAHAAGIVHGDFKPENVLLTSDQRVRVTDFGLARRVEPDEVAPTSPSASRLVPRNALIGTVAYMSPEQLCGSPSSPATDQFAFCAALHAALYGERAFYGESLEALRGSIVNATVRAPSAAAAKRVPRSLARVVARGLSATPEGRYPSMNALLDQLRKAVSSPRRRRRLVAVAALIGIASVGAVALLRSPSPEDRCLVQAAQIGSSWSDDLRTKLSAHYQNAESPVIAEALPRVAMALDAYARRWRLVHAETCKARFANQQQSPVVFDLRMACLGARRAELGSFVSALSTAGASELVESPLAVHRLSGLSDCEDVERHTTVAPSPTDPRGRSEFRAIQEQIGEARGLLSAGKFSIATERVSDLEARASELGHQPTIAAVHSIVGDVYRQTGEITRAIDTYKGCELAAERGRDDVTKARCLAALGWLLQSEGNPTLAVEVAKRAEATVERVPNAFELDADIHRLLGDLARLQGDYAGARRFLADALARLEGRQTLIGALVHVAYFGLHSNVGEFQQALESATQAVEVMQSLVGEEHPNLADTLDTLGGAHSRLGQFAAAEAVLTRSIRIRRRAHGAEHPGIAMSQSQLGLVYVATDRFGDAKSVLENARALVADRPSAQVAVQIDSLLARVYMSLDEPHRALEFARRVYKANVEAWGADSRQVVEVEFLALAPALRAMGDIDAAVRHFEHAIAQSADNPLLRLILVEGFGEQLLTAGRSSEARENFVRVLSDIGRDTDRPLLLLATASNLALATLDVRLGRLAGAAKYVERAITAIDSMEEGSAEAAEYRAHALAALAQIRARTKEGSLEAVPLARQSVEQARTLNLPSAALLDSALTALVDALIRTGELKSALEAASELVDVNEKARSSNIVGTAEAKIQLARVHRARGECRTALKSSRAAHAELSTRHEPGPLLASSVELGMCAITVGEWEEALAVLAVAVELANETELDVATEATARFGLAQVLAKKRSAASKGRARRLARDAITALRKIEGVSAPSASDVTRWLTTQ